MSRKRLIADRRIAVAVIGLLGWANGSWAGMPSVTLTDVSRLRMESISFFLVCLLLCTGVIQLVWNGLRRDFPRLPRLSYRRALGLVFLWGLLFLLVLSMISGTRELLTPGAWKKDGLTYKLAEPASGALADSLIDERRRALESLRVALWSYAPTHGGKFPPDDKVPEIPAALWRVPDPSGLRFGYVGSLQPNVGQKVLAYEPGLFGNDRLVLMTDGEIRTLTSAELETALKSEGTR